MTSDASTGGDLPVEESADPIETDTESYHGYSVDDEDQPQGDGDSMADNRGLAEPLDEGFSPGSAGPRDRGSATRPARRRSARAWTSGSPRRSRRRTPTSRPSDMSVEAIENDGDGGEVGDARTGRLVAPDEGSHEDRESDEVADDVGIDGAGASAEEAAVHTIE